MHLDPHLDLPFAHDLVHDLVVVLVDFGLVIALLVAQDPQGLRALQLNLKLLGEEGTSGTRRHGFVEGGVSNFARVSRGSGGPVRTTS